MIFSRVFLAHGRDGVDRERREGCCPDTHLVFLAPRADRLLRHRDRNAILPRLYRDLGLADTGRWPDFRPAVAVPEAFKDAFFRLLAVPISEVRVGEHILSSLSVVLGGWLLAAVVGMPLGIAMAWWRRLRWTVFPVFQLVRPVPPLAWIPLAIIWLGIGTSARMSVVFVAALVPWVMNSMQAVASVDPILIQAARTLGASNRVILFARCCAHRTADADRGGADRARQRLDHVDRGRASGCILRPWLCRTERVPHARHRYPVGRDGDDRRPRCVALLCDASVGAGVSALVARGGGIMATLAARQADPTGCDARQRSDLGRCVTGSVVLLWFVVTSGSALIAPRLLPSPATLAERFATLAVTPFGGNNLLGHAAASLERWALGVLAAIAVGLPLGVLFAWLPPFRAALMPVFELLRYIPPFAWVPIAMLWFGASTHDAGAHRLHRRVSGVRHQHATRRQSGRQRAGAGGAHARRGLVDDVARMSCCLLPRAMPSPGMRIAVSNGWMALVGAELVVGKLGLGFLISQGQANDSVATIFVGMIAIGLLGVVIDSGVRWLQRVAAALEPMSASRT